MKKFKYVLMFFIFNILLFTVLVSMNYVFRNKEYEGAQDLFKKWNPEHADIVFIGNSHQFCSISTDLLYNEYGIESYMLATSAQTIPMSYYAAMEAIELHKPDRIVLEVSYTANDFRTLEGMDHCFFDGFPRCRARSLALKDLIEPKDRIYYLIPLGMFHNRWKELTKEDFGKFNLSERGSFVNTDVCANFEIPMVGEDEKEPMPPEMEKYMDMLVKLCEENDVELIMYAAPFNGLYDDEGSRADVKGRQRVFNYVGEYCQKKNVEYHNLFHEFSHIGIDANKDWRDTQHFNLSGQEKFTRYMVESGYLGID